MTRAWVAFTGKTEIFWLLGLRPGFRHCFAVLREGGLWVTIDPLAHKTLITVHDDLPADFDLITWLRRDAKCRVVAANMNEPAPHPAPFALFTCVEAVKRVLGLHDRFIFTPWQLYRRLTIHRKKGK